MLQTQNEVDLVNNNRLSLSLDRNRSSRITPTPNPPGGAGSSGGSLDGTQGVHLK
jgi:hypothetical protein